MRSALSLYAVLMTITSSTQAGNVVYVDAGATGSVHDGSSWCSAYVDLQQALAVASVGTEVRIAQGVYRPAPAGGSRDAAFAVPTGVTLLGGFRGCGTPDPDERDFVLYATVLSGDLAEVTVPRELFATVLDPIQRFGVPPPQVQRGRRGD